MRQIPRICIIGPILGKYAGWVSSQGEILAGHLKDAGWNVRLTSKYIMRLPRLLDIIRSLLVWHKDLDLVVIMVFSGPAFWIADISSWLAKKLGKPIVFWLHGGNLPNFSLRNPTWVRRVLNRGAAFCSPSGFLSDFFNSLGFEIKVIPNIIDLEKYPFCKRDVVKPRLLWMRTFHPLYNPIMAVKAFAEILKTNPDALLTMAGQDKGLLKRIRQITAENHINDRVRFPGFLDEKSKRIEFDSHDIYLHTNREDNMPVSVIEAAAFGLPIIATRVGGIPYLLEDEKTALLVDENDVASMVAAIRRLLNNSKMTELLSTNGRIMSELSSSTVVVPQWMEYLQSVLQNIQ